MRCDKCGHVSVIAELSIERLHNKREVALKALKNSEEHIALLRKENEALQKQVSSLKKALVKLGLEQE